MNLIELILHRYQVSVNPSVNALCRGAHKKKKPYLFIFMNTDTAVRKCRWVTLYRGTYGNNRYCGIIITFVTLLSQKMDILSARKKRKSK